MNEEDHPSDRRIDDHAIAVGRAATRVLIAAATTLYRDGVLAALSDDDRFFVVGSAQDEREFIWRLVAEQPDVALLDVDLLRAVAAQGLLPAQRDGGPRIVVLAVDDREEHLAACETAGATEIVRRRADREELLAAIERAVVGDGRLSPLRDALGAKGSSGQALASSSSASAVSAGGTALLTPREAEILALIEAGRTNKAIALELGCSQSTVKNHVHALLAKLGVNRRAEAARIAREYLPAAAG